MGVWVEADAVPCDVREAHVRTLICFQLMLLLHILIIIENE